jgi:vacuolar protein sorting-associated protein 13A/C
MALRKKLEEEKRKQQAAQQSWGNWIWGSSSSTQIAEGDPIFGGPMTEEQRKQLYEALDYDEKTAVIDALQAPRDSIKLRATMKLNRGSLALKSDPHGKNKEVTSLVFDIFHANFVQRPANFEASISLNNFKVFDGATENTLYSQIVHVKTEQDGGQSLSSDVELEPFFFVKFENNPLDERADDALTVRMRHMEIIYHRGYVEAIYKFFKPPASQLESVEALLVCHFLNFMLSLVIDSI